MADGDVKAIVAASGADNPIIVKRTVRLPAVENWNELLARVETEWFILLSDDDYLAPNHVSSMLGALRRFPAVDVAHSRLAVINENDEVTSYSPSAPEWESAVDFLWHRIRGYRVQFLSDFIWRTSALKAAGGFASNPSGWGSDDVTALRLATKHGIAYSSEPTFFYRVHTGSITGGRGVVGKINAVRQMVAEYSEFCRKVIEVDQARGIDRTQAIDIQLRLNRFSARQIEDLLAATVWMEFFSGRILTLGLPSALFAKAIARKIRHLFK
jgi:hypothetical protein